MAAERRRHERVRIRAEARVAHGAEVLHLWTRDLSLGGALVAGPGDAALAPGGLVEVALLPHEDAPYHAECGDGATFRAAARIVRQDARGLGLAFESIDVENHARLHALVEVHD